jgi:hypothetical protein
MAGKASLLAAARAKARTRVAAASEGLAKLDWRGVGDILTSRRARRKQKSQRRQIAASSNSKPGYCSKEVTNPMFEKQESTAAPGEHGFFTYSSASHRLDHSCDVEGKLGQTRSTRSSDVGVQHFQDLEMSLSQGVSEQCDRELDTSRRNTPDPSDDQHVAPRGDPQPSSNTETPHMTTIRRVASKLGQTGATTTTSTVGSTERNSTGDRASVRVPSTASRLSLDDTWESRAAGEATERATESDNADNRTGSRDSSEHPTDGASPIRGHVDADGDAKDKCRESVNASTKNKSGVFGILEEREGLEQTQQERGTTAAPRAGTTRVQTNKQSSRRRRRRQHNKTKNKKSTANSREQTMASQGMKTSLPHPEPEPEAEPERDLGEKRTSSVLNVRMGTAKSSFEFLIWDGQDVDASRWC